VHSTRSARSKKSRAHVVGSRTARRRRMAFGGTQLGDVAQVAARDRDHGAWQACAPRCCHARRGAPASARWISTRSAGVHPLAPGASRVQGLCGFPGSVSSRSTKVVHGIPSRKRILKG
jgi:hypothetical protein